MRIKTDDYKAPKSHLAVTGTLAHVSVRSRLCVWGVGGVTPTPSIPTQTFAFQGVFSYAFALAQVSSVIHSQVSSSFWCGATVCQDYGGLSLEVPRRESFLILSSRGRKS